MENKGVLEPLWKHLRPVSQRRLRMTCSKIRNMTKDWKDNVPDIKELSDKNKVKEWFLESRKNLNTPVCVNERLWRWSHKISDTSNHVSLEVRFENCCSSETTKCEQINIESLYTMRSIKIQNGFSPNYHFLTLNQYEMTQSKKRQIALNVEGEIYLSYKNYLTEMYISSKSDKFWQFYFLLEN